MQKENVVDAVEKDQKKGLVPREEYFPPPEVAKMMGVSDSWLYKGVEAGRIPLRRIGRMIRFHRKDIVELMNTVRTGPISPKGHGEVEKRPQEERLEMSETWLKAKDVAKKIGVSKDWVLRKARCKIIPCFRVGGIIRFSEREIDEWMKAHSVKGVLKV